ncbi:GMP/IMP nucleotidase YrfG [hydrothermal vent metagenome]|uniref:GMP/IMP nucleotidase YrfG n=1 Tax=hydrothermal vent metagenome TaxID=652676 RepID=A0A3B1A588_9ZZZZ
MIDWNKIKTVFLDMDGTLLDLNFDNYFWQQHVPQRYAELHNIDIAAANELLIPKFRELEGTMNWYCVDYWSETLGLDIELLKSEINHLIAVQPHVIDFLDMLKQKNIQRILVTNAHQKSLNLKMKHTALHHHLDQIICAHDFKIPKEHQEFWVRLQQQFPFENTSTLFIDDSIPVLRSAQNYGIEYLLAIYKPDSKREIKDVEDFQAIHHFNELL